MEPERKKQKKQFAAPKWATCGVNPIFERPYTPHGVGIRYQGKLVPLTPAQEEAATSFLIMINNLKLGFFEDGKIIIGKGLQNFDDTFSHIQEWVNKESGNQKESPIEKEKKKEKENKKERPIRVVSSTYVPKGLLNFGNSCFFNAVVQVLIELEVVRLHFRNYKGRDDVGMGFSTIIDSKSSDQIGHNLLYNAMRTRHADTFKAGEVGDSQELLMLMIGEIDKLDERFVRQNFSIISIESCLKCGTVTQNLYYFLPLSLQGEGEKSLQRLFCCPCDEFCLSCKSNRQHTFQIKEASRVLLEGTISHGPYVDSTHSCPR